MSLVDGAKEHVKQLANKVAERVNFNFAIAQRMTRLPAFGRVEIVEVVRSSTAYGASVGLSGDRGTVEAEADSFATVTSSTPSSGFHLTSAHIAALGSNRLSFRI
jgi:hypothetical protein